MAALVGRKVTFTPTAGGVAVAGGRTKSITLNNEGIDITSDDDNGFRTMLGDDPALRSLEMSVDGILKDDGLIALAAQGGSALIEAYDLAIPGIGTFSGDFYFGSITLGAPYNEAVTFSATVQSSGEFTYTPVVVGP
jgi:predicted secreted protein